MKVLMTGATGFVGSRLREFVRRDGHQVRLLVRKESREKANRITPAGAYEILLGDPFDTNVCLRACDGCDAVIHLIGIIREFPAQGITFDEIHRVATSNVVDAAKRTGVEQFIHMSALGVRDDSKSEYHRSKRAGERIVEQSGLRWTIFRPSWIFAPGDELSGTIKDVVRHPVVPLIDGGRSLVQPVALDDACACFARSLRMPETQGKTYELGGPDRVSYREIFEQAASNMGRKARTVSVPSTLIRPFVGILQRFKSFPLTVDELKMLAEDNVCDIDQFVRTFRVEPASFRQAIPAMFG
jgi:NADH dehydrogenase